MARAPIQIELRAGEALRRVWASAQYRYWYAVVETCNGGARWVSENGGGNYGPDVTPQEAYEDVATRVHVAQQVDGINYKLVETTAAVVVRETGSDAVADSLGSQLRWVEAEQRRPASDVSQAYLRGFRAAILTAIRLHEKATR